MKRLLSYALICFLCVLLVGCGSDTKKENTEENTNTNTNENVNEDTEDTNTDLKMTSTDDKLIFTDSQGFYMIFNYEGETLKNIEWVMDYEDKNTAQIAYNIYTSSEYKEEYDATIDGTKVTLTYKEDYADETYGAITKSEMEAYMTAAGYTYNK